MNVQSGKVEHGFTLLEVMIALGGAAVIATFAVPTYTQHVARGCRMDAVAALYRAAQWVESARSVNGEYATKLPAGSDQTPSNGAATYTLTLFGETDTNGGYTIEAAPSAEDECGIFTLDATGAHSNRAAEKFTPLKIAACWGSK